MRRSATLLGISFLLSKILGLIRDNLLAATFGATGGIGVFNLDTYYAAFRLPDLLYNLLSYGVLSSAFIPLFIETKKKEGESSAFRFANEIFLSVGLAILFVSVALWIFAPNIIPLFVPGFSAEDFQTTVDLTRIMLATPILFTLASVASGIQNAENKFLGLAVAPIFYNLGIILGIIFWSAGNGVYGAALGVSIGAFLHLLATLPGMFRLGFRFKLPAALWTARVKEMIALSLPRIFGMSVTQISLIVSTIIASTLATGSIVIMNFVSNLESLPVGMIGISIAVVSFGTLSAHAALGNMKALTSEVSENLRKILFLLIPATAGMIVLRFQIVRLLLGRGKFTWTDTILTADTLGIFSIGLAFGGIVFLLARAFYALKDTKTPVTIGIAAVVTNIGVSLVSTKIFHFETFGLAAANALANIVNAIFLLWFLTRRLRTRVLEIPEIMKFVVAALIMAALVQFTKSAFGNIFEDIDTYIELGAQTGTAILVGAGVYFGMCRLLRCKNAKI